MMEMLATEQAEIVEQERRVYQRKREVLVRWLKANQKYKSVYCG